MIAGRTESARWARRLVVIAGPTASGKSALALALARRLGGAVINADAMQCYRELRVLTARPTPAEEAAAPHMLYGVRAAAAPAHAAWWRGAALAAMAAMETTQTPILCGGTGMYLAALINGIAAIPDPGEAARATARQLLAEIGPLALHARLDAPTAAKLNPADSQRIARAYEVLLGTGQGLAFWQARKPEPLAGWRVRLILLDPPREALRVAISARFDSMLAGGAVAEVRDLLAIELDAALPLMRAHGVPELGAYISGEMSLDAAAAAAVLATHQYTKRQATWFRHQKLVENSAMQTIHARIANTTQLSTSFIDGIVNFIMHDG